MLPISLLHSAVDTPSFSRPDSDLLCILDGNLRWIIDGPAVANVLGYCPLDYPHLSLEKLLTPASLARLQESVEEELAPENLSQYSGVPYWSRSLRVEQIHKDGTRLWSETRLTFLNQEDCQAMILVSCRPAGMPLSALDPEQLRADAVLKETASALSVISDLDDVLDRILENTQKIVPNDNANIMLVEDGIARIVRYRGSYSEEEKRAIFAQDLVVEKISTLHQMQETGKPLLVADTHGHPLWSYVPSGTWIRSYVAAPVRIKNITLGFINLNSPCPGFFSPLHAQQLQAFADQAALAIDNARMLRDLQRQTRLSFLLNDITRTAISATHLDSMLRLLADRLGELLLADGSVITLWDAENQALHPAAAYGQLRTSPSEIVVQPEAENLLLAALETGHTLPCTDSPVHTAGDEEARGAMLALPLEADGTRLGAALLTYRQPRVFGQDEMLLAGQAAAQISLALYKAQLLEAERSRSLRLARANELILALGNVATRLQSVSNITGVMDTLAEELSKLGVYCLMAYGPGIDAAYPEQLPVYYLTLDRHQKAYARLKGKSSRCEWSLTEQNFPLYGEVVYQKKPVFVSNWDVSRTVLNNLGVNGSAEKILRRMGVTPHSSHFYLPLMTDHAVFGTLCLWGENLEQSDLPVASAFASQVSIALENARLYAEVKHLAITDPLTGLYNRRGLAEFGAHEVERAQRFGRPLSLIMVDIDHFKTLNDRFGHSAGDVILKNLARTGRESIRSTDIFVRHGGEEFIVLLPETDQLTACKVAERVRSTIENMHTAWQEEDLQVTISLGVSTLAGGVDGINEMVLAADQALYQAKRSGRNCTRAA